MKELNYPFKPENILKNKKSIKLKLLDSNNNFTEKNIAILGGVTTNDIKSVLELFLLNNGIKPNFYESEYNKFFEDSVFENEELKEFKPDIIYLCTSIKNLVDLPEITDDKATVNQKLENCYKKFEKIWTNLSEKYHCSIIQNNFEYPYYRLMGNKDASDIHGYVNFITRLNLEFYDYAQSNDNFFICDINYISASYGLEKWSEPYYWHLYKYSVSVPAIPYLAFNVANIIKSIFGKNKKILNLDLDNTLWGGIVGEDGAENIEIGKETPLGENYLEFQQYLKKLKNLGVLLSINSKNDEKNALAGLERPDSVLKKDDFVSIKANWNSKSQNLAETATELNLLPESFVFVDDNLAEREIVSMQFPKVCVPEMDMPENYIKILDKSGFFEVTSFSQDDINRTKMYKENKQRLDFQTDFVNYEDYLKSLEMKCEIKDFEPMFMSRISQLINKINQFNLTAKRYTQSEIEKISTDNEHITLYAKLYDKFGDNGAVSAIIGEIRGNNKEELHIELWLMSCRVIKRNVEFAMFDELVAKAISKNIKTIYGYYYPSSKNSMVKDLYQIFGFEKIEEGDCTVWKFDIPKNYEKKNKIITVIH